MSDRTLAEGLLDVAEKLCARVDGREPTQAALRRGQSTAYYAHFHDMSRMSADTVAGGEHDEDHDEEAWDESYRGLNHGTAAEACGKIKGGPFPDEVRTYAEVFEQMREARNLADYDPTVQLQKK